VLTIDYKHKCVLYLMINKMTLGLRVESIHIQLKDGT